MQQLFLYVANWKMGFTHAQAIEFCAKNLEQLNELTTSTSTIVLCPSFTELACIKDRLKNSAIQIGAQNCSQHKIGAYTGDIPAQTLQEIGCSYCIVGHSERRTHHHEADLVIAAKVERLLEVGITPIVCIGETKEQYENRETTKILQKQLDLVTDVLNEYNGSNPTICIAYEPVWAIGTGLIPEKDYLIEIFHWLANTCSSLTTNITYQFLYGGSVDAKNIGMLRALPGISGFLIGSASLDFQKFKNIVSLPY